MGNARRASRTLLCALSGLPILLLIQRACVRATNFGGFDEWPMLELSSRWVVGFPHANRPLGMLWILPASLLPYRLLSFQLLSFVYLLASALLVFRLCQRLLPSRPLLGFVAASLVVSWAPGDVARLNCIECAVFGGFTFAALAAIVGFVESWFEARGLMLVLACLLVPIAARSYEGSFALLTGAPLLLLLTQAWSRRLAIWSGAWMAAVGVAAAATLIPVLAGGGSLAYQATVLKPEFDPAVLFGRFVWQFVYHLAPLVLSPPSELAVRAVPWAVGLFAVLFALAQRGSCELADREAWRCDAWSALLGLGFAGLGYALIVVGSGAPTAYRLQFLSGPGMAVALASVVMGLARLAPARAREAVAFLLAAWVVAVGAGRTVAMQQSWDRASAYPAQMSMLRGLVSRAPDLRPGTMVLLLDEGGAWRATFGFHHAIQYLYQRRAAGCVWGAWDALYPGTLGPEGLHSEPWSVIRGPWSVRPHTYRYDEIVVARFSGGRVEILKEWPATLPPVPAGALYDPGSRIQDLSLPVPERRLLR